MPAIDCRLCYIFNTAVVHAVHIIHKHHRFLMHLIYIKGDRQPFPRGGAQGCTVMLRTAYLVGFLLQAG